MRKDWLANAATVVLMVCALLVTGLIVRREVFARGPEIVRTQGGYVQGWEEYARQGRVMGPARAPVTLVEFSDFQCPACRTLASSIRAVREKYPEDLRVVYRHFPLPTHTHAVTAARASECAAEQGRFEPFHDALYAHQDSIGIAPWSRFATIAGLRDLAAFERCVRNEGPLAVLQRDTAAGRKLGITATPTLIVNGELVNGAPPPAALEKIIRDARNARPRTAGTR